MHWNTPRSGDGALDMTRFSLLTLVKACQREPPTGGVVLPADGWYSSPSIIEKPQEIARNFRYRLSSVLLKLAPLPGRHRWQPPEEGYRP